MSTKLQALSSEPRIFDQALPQELFLALLNLSQRVGWQYGWTTRESTQHRYWHHEIARGSKDNTVDVTENVKNYPSPLFSVYLDWLRKNLVSPEDKLLRFYLNAHTFGTDGFPHTDTTRSGEASIILYLTPEWKPEWCGETVVFDASGNIVAAAMPKLNRLFSFPSNALHSPRPLAKEFTGLRVVCVAKFAPPDYSSNH